MNLSYSTTEDLRHGGARTQVTDVREELANQPSNHHMMIAVAYHLTPHCKLLLGRGLGLGAAHASQRVMSSHVVKLLPLLHRGKAGLAISSCDHVLGLEVRTNDCPARLSPSSLGLVGSAVETSGVSRRLVLGHVSDEGWERTTFRLTHPRASCIKPPGAWPAIHIEAKSAAVTLIYLCHRVVLHNVPIRPVETRAVHPGHISGVDVHRRAHFQKLGHFNDITRVTAGHILGRLPETNSGPELAH